VIKAQEAAAKHQTLRITIQQNVNNYSLGGSHKVAFNYCLAHGFSHCIVLHGDDQGDIRDLIAKLDEGVAVDCFLGSRFQKGSQLVGYGTVRIWGNYGFNALFSLLCRRMVTDLGSGLNMYRAAYLRSKFYLAYPDDLTFNHYLLLHAIFAKANLKFFPISWREEDQVSNAKLLQFGLRTLRLLFRELRDKDQILKLTADPTKDYASRVVYQNITS
jgi:hypothetical protein